MFHLIYEVWGRQDTNLFWIFKYVTFRSLMAGITSMFICFIFGGKIINFLYKLKFKENIRTDGPKSHESKSGTPTMGGLMIIFSLVISVFLWGNWSNPNVILLTSFCILFAGLGFRDDYEKAILKIKGGMRSRTKFIISVVLATSFAYLYYFVTAAYTREVAKGVSFSITDLFIPFIKFPVWEMGFVALIFGVFVIIGTSHAVNLTDGLDGLAAGTVLIVTVTLAAISYVSGTPIAADYLNIPYLPGAHEYTVVLSGLAGALLGFLWFNSHPAQVFMGDTGSLFLGATIGMVAVMLKKEILLLVLGGVFVVEVLSVILQVGSFKLTGKRIFKMAPLHHHFEMHGMKETKIVIRFWIAGVILALFALSTLKIQ